MEPRNYLANASATPPAAPAAPSSGYPQSGVPGVSEATVPGPYWFYKLGEELRTVISASGQTPDDTSLAQLLAGIKSLAGSNIRTVPAVDSPATLSVADAGTVIIDASAGNVVINLPPASALKGSRYDFIRLDTSANSVTINADAAAPDDIGGQASWPLNVAGTVSLVSYGLSTWYHRRFELATDAEVQAGAETKKIVSPASLASFPRQHSNPGYQRFPGGLIIQWGTTSIVNTGAIGTIVDTVNVFPITFPTMCLQVNVSGGDILGSNEACEHTYAPNGHSSTSVTIRATRLYGDSAGVSDVFSYSYIAIGY